MNRYVVHIRRHAGWETVEADGDIFAEAAVTAVVETCKHYGLDLDRIPHTVEYDDSKYPLVRFREASEREIFDYRFQPTTTRPGDFWFSEQVREGEPDDCRKCGGTGISFYNPFRQCWACGDRKAEVDYEHVGGGRYVSIPETRASGKTP